MTARLRLFALLAVAAIPAAASAQHTAVDSTAAPPAMATPAVTPTVQTPAAAPTTGPVVRPSAVRADVAPQHAALDPSAALAPNMGQSQSRALMIVGGAGLLAGAIIGGSSGTVIMVAGVVVGAIGLYNYLQ